MSNHRGGLIDLRFFRHVVRADLGVHQCCCPYASIVSQERRHGKVKSGFSCSIVMPGFNHRWHDFIYKIKNKNIKKTESFTNNSEKVNFLKEHFDIESLSKEDTISNIVDIDQKTEDEGENEELKHQFPIDDEFGEHWIKFEGMKGEGFCGCGLRLNGDEFQNPRRNIWQ